eukprot:1154840-Pelagomonas_calceolata.AAC.1
MAEQSNLMAEGSKLCNLVGCFKATPKGRISIGCDQGGRKTVAVALVRPHFHQLKPEHFQVPGNNRVFQITRPGTLIETESTAA